jgi:hypothetical protein
MSQKPSVQQTSIKMVSTESAAPQQVSKLATMASLSALWSWRYTDKTSLFTTAVRRHHTYTTNKTKWVANVSCTSPDFSWLAKYTVDNLWLQAQSQRLCSPSSSTSSTYDFECETDFTLLKDLAEAVLTASRNNDLFVCINKKSMCKLQLLPLGEKISSEIMSNVQHTNDFWIVYVTINFQFWELCYSVFNWRQYFNSYNKY